MTTLILVLFGVSFLGGAALAGFSFWKARGTRLVTCPENASTAAVELASLHAAWTGLVGRPDLRLAGCSRWPEKEGCGQECLRQIESAPGSCLVRRILEEWYADRKCAICGRELGHAAWLEQPPALLRPDGVSVALSELVPEKIPETLRTHAAVCSDCHIASTFRRKFPDLVVDRPWDSAHGGRH